MERLLVLVQYSDGFTFSTENHLPAVYSSKEEFEITLEDILKEHIDLLKKENIAKDICWGKIEKEKSKNGGGNIVLIQSLLQDEIKHENEIKRLSEFDLGGATWDVSSFTYYDSENKKLEISMPSIYTLDEYFKEVEEVVSKSKKIKI